ncbi:Stage III sporulation protein AE [Koleobacter methoxysyntrophicus]|uniref:Stage III sporulation protein AE n=1 Tax=Koleobacter methoxysyntrophicus TaxID=2751313 RepID=A0A8A0RR58_9FIRM|nr:stage III sporulation protein AE [Koleobacter methoxysyntrophicus]MDK2901444.1 stage sporulation protein [Thermosediminibacterales bacterium]QSQ10040.1 Stage III sporulation protein AE [Koleobacter methoxysyntrophicus]
MGKIKPFKISILMISIIFLLSGMTFAQEEIDIIDEQISKLDFSQVEELLNSMNRDVEEFIPEFTIDNLINLIKNKDINYSFKSFFAGVFNYFFKEVIANSQLLAKLIILAVLLAILQNLQSAFEKDNISKLAYSVCYLILIGIIVNSFTIALSLGKQAINDMVNFLHAILPLLLSLLVALGGFASAAVFHPIILMTISGVGTLIRDILLPLIFLSSILTIVDNITDAYKVSRMSGLLREISIGLLGFFLSIFLGVMIIQGAGAAVADGVSVRTAKFATKNFFPIVGGIFADAIDMVIGCSLLLKNSIGIFGAIVVFLICIFPVIKIISIMVIYKIASALVEPLGENKIVKCLNDVGNSLTMIFVCVSAVAMMLFIAITIIIGAGNVMVMMR